MTPDERQMLADLFQRIHATGSTPRDAQAEAFINDGVRAEPHAPYVLAQTVLIQQQALEAASRRIAELEAQAKGAAPAQETSFLGGLGKALFGSPAPSQAPIRPAPDPYPYQPRQPGYAPAPQPGPWGAPAGGGGGGGFLGNALTTAAGVAGGLTLANALGGLFGGHSGGLFGGSGQPVVNNFFEEPQARDRFMDNSSSGQLAQFDDPSQGQPSGFDDAQNSGDYAGDDSSGGFDDSSGSYDV